MPLDATLGRAGTPQSGTGQTSLLTGVNAAERFGSHFGPWTPVSLRPLVEEGSLLRQAVDAGHATAFANAYPRGWPALAGRTPGGPERSVRPAAPPLAARAAGLLTRHEDALARGEAVASEIENAGWRRHLGHADVPEIAPAEAGRVLARIAAAHRLTFFAHYSTDTAGHRGGMPGGVAALERVDAFLGGFLDAAPPDTVLLVSSDHGNVEDVSGGHTRNPVPGLVVGPDAERRAARMTSILDVAGCVRDWLAED